MAVRTSKFKWPIAVLLSAALVLLAPQWACLLPRAALSAEPAKGAKGLDIWEAYFLQRSKIGYGHTVARPVQKGGQTLWAIDSINRLSITRFAQRTEQDLKMSTLETPDGQVLEFTTDMSFGPNPMIVRGHVSGQQMILETQTKGTRQTSKIPWSPEIRGFRAVEQSLERAPIKPGEKRTLKMLLPVVNQIADVRLAAADYETTSVLGIDARLLRVESVARMPDGNALESTMWVDAQGQTIKTRVAAMQQESFRTTREVATATQPDGRPFDLGFDAIVKPDKPLPGIHALRQARYQVELTNADPAKVFATGATQSVRSTGPKTAEITVRSLPIENTPAASSAEPVGKAYTSPSAMLQSDDSRIVAMAEKARGAAKAPSQIAVALERYVHDTVSNKNFSQTFATAAEVAESREGDCTEHAVLLAALARACGIPSRVAIGLVYVESAGGFGYHMWTEAYLDGRWVPLDATLGRGGIGAGHLKLTDSALDGPTAYSAFLSVAQVMGQLKIDVLDAE